MSSMRIVVGVDSSEGSRAALRHAAQQAAAHDAELVVVHAWEAPFKGAHGSEASEVLRALGRQQADQLLDEVLTAAQSEGAWAVRRVRARPVEGEASAVLTAAVREGDLLVVGANRGELVRRLLLGSVSSRVARSADGPVVVVPGPRRRRVRRDRRRPADHRGRAGLTAAGR